MKDNIRNTKENIRKSRLFHNWMIADQLSHMNDNTLNTKENIRKSSLFQNRMKADQLSACIIATAAYESPFAPEVEYLRTIRDTKIRSTEIGNKLMDNFESIYYIFSPRVAYCMVQDKNLNTLISWTIVRPIVSFFRVLMKLFRKEL